MDSMSKSKIDPIEVGLAIVNLFHELERRFEGEKPDDRAFEGALKLLDGSGGGSSGLAEIGFSGAVPSEVMLVVGMLEIDSLTPIADLKSLARIQRFASDWHTSALKWAREERKQGLSDLFART